MSKAVDFDVFGTTISHEMRKRVCKGLWAQVCVCAPVCACAWVCVCVCKNMCFKARVKACV